MAAGNISSEKIDLLVYGPIRPILENGFSDQYVLHKAEGRADLERLTPDVLAKTRGMAVTYHTVPADAKALAHFPKLEIIASFGVGYDHIDAKWAGEHRIVVTNTPEVLNEEVADTALGLLLCTVRELPQSERYLRAGKWKGAHYPLTKATLRDRTVGMVGMGRIGKAIARRLEAFGVPVVYHSRNPQTGIQVQRTGRCLIRSSLQYARYLSRGRRKWLAGPLGNNPRQPPKGYPAFPAAIMERYNKLPNPLDY